MPSDTFHLRFRSGFALPGPGLDKPAQNDNHRIQRVELVAQLQSLGDDDRSPSHTQFPSLLSGLPCHATRNRLSVSNFIYSEPTWHSLEINDLTPVQVSKFII